MASNNLLDSILQTVKSAKEAIAEGTDLMTRIATDSEVLSQVPVISTAVKVLNIKDSFVRHRLERNVIAFLKAVEHADIQAIDDLLNQFQNDTVYADDFTDTVLSILLEGQKPIKSELVGKLVVALSLKSITKKEFESLSQIIQTASPPSLLALLDYYAIKGVLSSSNNAAHLQFAALEPLLFSLGIASRSGSSFRISSLGQKLYVHGFGGSIS